MDVCVFSYIGFIGGRRRCGCGRCGMDIGEEEWEKQPCECPLLDGGNHHHRTKWQNGKMANCGFRFLR